ncbi:hypothetical protein NDU88_003850 [Pleurodeles waltl]|uniref:Uncharacterized protein n=1 Tax=Pleurodeles waltl TaxID=8319 RepID=A0AAV7KZP6_PLEWA|nr:hypothetical protein NDU88_003850 [Pleurodeles waltl]
MGKLTLLAGSRGTPWSKTERFCFCAVEAASVGGYRHEQNNNQSRRSTVLECWHGRNNECAFHGRRQACNKLRAYRIKQRGSPPHYVKLAKRS